jgi:hypothetical protein
MLDLKESQIKKSIKRSTATLKTLIYHYRDKNKLANLAEEI